MWILCSNWKTITVSHRNKGINITLKYEIFVTKARFRSLLSRGIIFSEKWQGRGLGQMIRIVLIDDDEKFLKYFCKMLGEIMAEEKMEFCMDTVIDPRKILESKRAYDIYFLDIVMPGISGIELAGKLRAGGNRKEFVFVSRYEQYMRSAIAVRPCGYIRKQHLEEDLREVLSHLKPLFAAKGAEVMLKSNKKDYVVQLPQIMFINSDGHYLRLMYADGSNTLIRNSMKVVEEELRQFAFLRVNNRCLINLLYLRSVNKNEVSMKNGHKEKITGKYLKEASIVLDNWMEAHRT